MSSTKTSCNDIISKAEIKELDIFLKSLLIDIDQKVAFLESFSSPRSINASPQEVVSDKECNRITQYSAVKDRYSGPDLANVVRYEETDTVDNQCHVSNTNQIQQISGIINNKENPLANSSLLDDLSSIDPETTIFSPVEPVIPSNVVFSQNKTVDKSLNSISSVDTIIRPALTKMTQTHNVNVPFSKLDGIPFQLFNAILLDKSTNCYVNIGSRSAAYYGDYPYSYSGITHPACSFGENKYLLHIVSYIQVVLPDFKFNSAMVHKYIDGKCTMPLHSDDEECIEGGSEIVTISLGDTRNMEFRNKHTDSVENVPMMHGEVLVMSKTSQKHFKHGISASLSNDLRLSITLRLMRKPLPSTSEEDQSNSHDHNSLEIEATNIENINPHVSQQPLSVRPDQDGYQDGPLLPPNLDENTGYPPAPSHIRHPMQKSTWRPHIQPNPILHQNRERSQYTWHRQGWQPSQRPLLPLSQNSQPPPIEQMNISRPSQPRPLPPRPIPPRPIPPRPIPPRPMPPQQNRQPEPFLFSPEIVNSSANTGHQDEVLYVSSSMFSDLDALKMSTAKIKAHVFFYRGANSKQMMDKLKNDNDVQNLAKKNSICKVFLMTGTNNVDGVCQQRQSLQDACSDISNTIYYVQSLFPSAMLNVINILPRVTENRRIAIKELNDHIAALCEVNEKLNYIDTYSNKLLTFSNGSRKSTLFKNMYQNDIDNVHLNRDGVIKLAKHLKYISHC